MKPEQWIIEDMQYLRKKSRNSIENSYLDLLQWYVKLMNSKEG